MASLGKSIGRWFYKIEPSIFFVLMAYLAGIIGANGDVVYKLHAVQRGETLKSVASRYGITVEQLRHANSSLNFPDNEPLPEGKILVVPLQSTGVIKGDTEERSAISEPSAKTKANAFWVYEAKDGETLESIAKNFKISEKILHESNRHIKIGETLRAGVTVLIPILIDYPNNDQKVRENSTSGQERISRANNNLNNLSASKVNNVDRAVSVNFPQYNREFPRNEGLQALNQNFAVIGIVKAKSAIYSLPGKNSARYYICQPGKKLVIVGRKNGWLGVLMVNGAIGWIQENSVTLTDKTLTLPMANMAHFVSYNSLKYSIVKEAMRYLGVPYRYGGNSTDGIDCSAFVQRVYAAFGIKLPRTATEQLKYGVAVDLGQIQPGDRVYFSNDGVRANHCGIYIGDGKFIHASGRHGRVTISSLYEPRYFNTLFRVLR